MQQKEKFSALPRSPSHPVCFDFLEGRRALVEEAAGSAEVAGRLREENRDAPIFEDSATERKKTELEFSLAGGVLFDHAPGVSLTGLGLVERFEAEKKE